MRFGIIGTNFISDWFVTQSKAVSGVEAIAVYSRKADTGAAFAEKHGISHVFSDIDEFMASGLFDAVYVASPTFMHAEHSMLAAENGKHVLCEKMIAVSLSEFLCMKAQAEKHGTVLLEAMRPIYDPALCLIEAEIEKLGGMVGASIEYLQYSSRYDKFKMGIVENAFDPSMKNSALADIGSYPLSVCVRLFGMPDSLEAKSVFLENGFEGEGHAVLKYGSREVDIIYSKIRNGTRPSKIECKLGYITFDPVRAPRDIRVFRGGACEILSIPEPIENMHYEVQAFYDCVVGRRELLPELLHTERVMRCVDMIYTSAEITFPSE